MARFLGLGNGSDGAVSLSSYTPLKYTCSGSSGSKSLTATGSFSTGQRLFIIQSRGTEVGGYEDNQVASYSSGTVTLVHPLERTYTDSGASQAQVLIVKEASSVTGSITVPAWDGNVGGVFVIACNGTFSGTVSATDKGYRGGRSGYLSPASVPHSGATGENYSNVSVAGGQCSGCEDQISPANYGTCGGGGGGAGARATDRSAGGGGGGYGTAGVQGKYNTETPTTVPGSAGTTYGLATLTSLFFGGAGGGGGKSKDVNDSIIKYGGNGGGIIVVYTDVLSSSASLVSNGGSGDNGGNGDIGGAGGGAGGSILIKARVANVSGTITATGGAGGTTQYPTLEADGSNNLDRPGGAGGVGRIRVEACSLSGTTSPGASTSIGGHNYCGILTGMI